MSATRRRKSSRAGKVIAVEMEGDGMRGFGAAQLIQARRVKHEQEGAVLGRVEHDGQNHAVILGRGLRRGNEDRLARVKPREVPCGRSAALGVDFDDAIEKVALDGDAGAPNKAIRLSRATLVIDARELERRIGKVRYVMETSPANGMR